MPKKRGIRGGLRSVAPSLFVFFAYLLVVLSIVLLVVGFSIDGVLLLSSENHSFWTIIASTWILSVLLFKLADRWNR